MSGIYIHIPFCKQACHYCNFHFSTSPALRSDMVNAIIREIDIRRGSAMPQEHIFADEVIETIYFGGGTPSILSVAEIDRILKHLCSSFTISANAEVTLEANPDDLSPEKTFGWKAAGINRLSIGIQSFIDRDLAWMNRAHEADDARRCIVTAQKSGIENISIDLIFGTPGLSNEEWQQNIKTAIDSGVKHIAAYALTVEPKTALDKMIAMRKKEDINPDAQADQFSMAIEQLQHGGFEHYEISNFALPGYRSRHNSSYWQGKKYMGLGPSAHSFNGRSRLWNLANNALYIKSIQQGVLPFEEEKADDQQRLNEYVMISLRTVEGVDLNYIEQHFSAGSRKAVEKNSRTDVLENNLLHLQDRLTLTNKGKLLADAISVRLFL